MVPLDQIDPSPWQARRQFDPKELEALAISIRENGMLQPVTLLQTGKNRYALVAGERRVRAARMIGMKPPRILLFVNNPAYCAENYLTFLKNVLRQAFGLTGLPIELELRARPKKVESIRREERPRRRPAEKRAGKKNNSRRRQL